MDSKSHYKFLNSARPSALQEYFSLITKSCCSSRVSLKETPFAFPDTSITNTFLSSVVFSSKQGSIYNAPQQPVTLHFRN
jgi:hypothetical protein